MGFTHHRYHNRAGALQGTTGDHWGPLGITGDHGGPWGTLGTTRAAGDQSRGPPRHGGAKLILHSTSPTDRPGRPREPGPDPVRSDRPTLSDPLLGGF